MENRYIEKFDSIIKIKVEGKNINNYIVIAIIFIAVFQALLVLGEAC